MKERAAVFAPDCSLEVVVAGAAFLAAAARRHRP
jgi:hypothetical protein